MLTVLLLPQLQTSADESRGPTVISNVSSAAVRLTSPLVRFPRQRPANYLRHVSDDNLLGRLGQYGICKIVSYCWFQSLASRLDPSQVHVHSLDPGCTKSPLSVSSVISRLYLGIFGRSPLICGRAIANSCLPVEGAHGAMLWDYEVEKYAIKGNAYIHVR